MKAAMMDKMEIMAGKIAQEKALHPQVNLLGTGWSPNIPNHQSNSKRLPAERI